MIFFDISAIVGFKSHTLRGIGRLVKGFYRSIKHTTPTVAFLPFCQNTFFDRLISHLPKGRDILKNNINYPINAYLKMSREDLAIIPSQTDTPFFFPRKYLTIVCDIIPFKYPDLYGAKSNPFRYRVSRFLERKGILNSFHIIAISEAVKKDLITFFGLPSDKISVVNPGIDKIFIENFSVQASENQNKRFIYYGGTDNRKNLSLILALSKIFPSFRFDLIVPGNPFKNSLPDNLRILSPCSDEDLVMHLKNSDGLIFPSLDEGFGFPVFESAALGVPVIANDLPSYSSLFGDSIWTFSKDIKSAADTLATFLNESKSVKTGKLIAARRIAEKFSWENAVASLRNVLCSLGYNV